MRASTGTERVAMCAEPAVPDTDRRDYRTLIADALPCVREDVHHRSAVDWRPVEREGLVRRLHARTR